MESGIWGWEINLTAEWTMQPLTSLPKVPPNVHFEYHPNECYDWGTMGWILSRKIVDVNRYNHFIFMNSSVRGPFLPAYLWVTPPYLHLLYILQSAH